jgi:hypothetical protein
VRRSNGSKEESKQESIKEKGESKIMKCEKEKARLKTVKGKHARGKALGAYMKCKHGK